MSRSKQYTEEFKAEAVRLSDGSEKNVRQVARDLGINFRTLESWRHKARQQQGTSRSRRGVSTASHAQAIAPTMAELERENQRLKRQMEVLRQERDILKKAMGIFVDSPGKDASRDALR